MNDSYTQRAHISRAVQPRGDRRGVDDGRGRLPADVVEAHEGEPAAGRVLAEAVAEREEVVLAVVALALADRAVQPRVEALAVRAPERVGMVARIMEAIYNFFQKSTARAPTPGLSIQIINDNPRHARRESALVKRRSRDAEGTDPTHHGFFDRINTIHLASSSATTASRTAQAIATSWVAMPVRSQTITVSGVARGGAPAHLCSPSSSVGRPSGR